MKRIESFDQKLGINNKKREFPRFLRLRKVTVFERQDATDYTAICLIKEISSTSKQDRQVRTLIFRLEKFGQADRSERKVTQEKSKTRSRIKQN